MSNDIRHTPSSTHIYGLYDPEGDGVTFYTSAAERDEAAKRAIQTYASDGTWYEEVTGVFAFVITHCATEIDVVRPVGEINPEDSCDEAGEYWPDTDCEYKCNYALKPFSVKETQQ